MIYTVTFNPSLDYVISVDDFEAGKVNRTTGEAIFAGGKRRGLCLAVKSKIWEVFTQI